MTKAEPNLLLIGLRGSGKSTIARALALAQNRLMIDLDELTLESFDDCASIGDVFEHCGEAVFRRAEFEALRQALEDHAKAIIALGGGTPTAPGAAELIEQCVDSGEARVAYLRCRPGILNDRLHQQSLEQQADRPPLIGDDQLSEIETLFRARDDLYQKLATRIFDDITTIDEAVSLLGDWMRW